MRTQWTWPDNTAILAATPIGNIGDATGRLMDALEQADIIAAEDTRKARGLIELLGVDTHAEVTSCYEHNEAERAAYLAKRIADEGARLLFISDAGMPSVSDPGFRLTTVLLDAGIDITVLPGASAVPTALALSGLETDRFCFEGFVERKAGRARRAFEELAGEKRTMVFFDSPKRVHATLELMADVFGAGRRAALCREMTKLHEEVIRGTLQDLVRATAGEVRGEIVLVVAGNKDDAGAQLSIEDAAVQAGDVACEQGIRLKEACKLVADRTGYKASELYRVATA